MSKKSASNFDPKNDAAYAADLGKLQELQTKRDSIKADIDRVVGRINESASPDGKPRTSDSPLTIRAKALLDGEPKETTGATALRTNLAALVDQRALLDEAIRLQRATVNSHIDRLSHTAAAEIGPKHREAVRRIVRAAVELAKANAAEVAIRAVLEDNGLNPGVTRPMKYGHVGDLADANSRISSYLREAVDYGFIDRKEAAELGLRDSRYVP